MTNAVIASGIHHVDTITDLVPEAAGVVRYDARLAESRAMVVTTVPASYKPPRAFGWMRFSPHGYTGRYLFVTPDISNAGRPH